MTIDNTMAGCKNPRKRVRKLFKRLVEMDVEIKHMQDKLDIMRGEIKELLKGLPQRTIDDAMGKVKVE